MFFCSLVSIFSVLYADMLCSLAITKQSNSSEVGFSCYRSYPFLSAVRTRNRQALADFEIQTTGVRKLILHLDFFSRRIEKLD